MKILGTEYTIKYVDSSKDLENISNTAQCDYSEKQIRVALHDEKMNKNSEEWVEESLMHEIAHAFLYETGNADVNDERSAELLSKFVRFVNSLDELKSRP